MFSWWDDNARPHRARIVQQFLQQNNADHLNWPAPLPDLSPIEHVWVILELLVRQRVPQPRTLQDLGTVLQEDWRRISNHIQSNFNSSNTDGSFTTANSNTVLSPYEILTIAQENKYLGFFVLFFLFLSINCMLSVLIRIASSRRF